jgi:putative solute:sodium symporter small subunit
VSGAANGADRASDQHQQIYLRRLHHRQLRIALLALGLCVAAVAALALVFVLAPGLDRARLAGIPLALLLVSIAVFPVLVLVGFVFEGRANALDQSAAALLGEDQP